MQKGLGKIIIVDNDPNRRDSLASELTEFGFQCVVSKPSQLNERLEGIRLVHPSCETKIDQETKNIIVYGCIRKKNHHLKCAIRMYGYSARGIATKCAGLYSNAILTPGEIMESFSAGS